MSNSLRGELTSAREAGGVAVGSVFNRGGAVLRLASVCVNGAHHHVALHDLRQYRNIQANGLVDAVVGRERERIRQVRAAGWCAAATHGYGPLSWLCVPWIKSLIHQCSTNPASLVTQIF